MKKNIIKIILGLLIIIFIISIVSVFYIIIYEKSNKQNLVQECPFCHSKNISHEEPKYKFTESYVIPMSTIMKSGEFGESGGIIKPIAHFDVKYYCNDCNKTFDNELEVDLLLEENKNKFQIIYKE